MDLRGSLLRYSKLLLEKGFIDEADLIEKMAHYEPVETPGVPSFWRRNFDYGEGFYYGDMSEKPGVKEWREQHKSKGPNFPLKKKKKAAMDTERVQQLYMEMTDYLQQLQAHAAKYAKRREEALQTGRTREAEEAADAYNQFQTLIKEANEKIDALVSKYGKDIEQPHAELLEQADRIINPKTLIDKFRTALFEKKYDDAKELYAQMSSQEKEEADLLTKRFYTASLRGFCKTAARQQYPYWQPDPWWEVNHPEAIDKKDYERLKWEEFKDQVYKTMDEMRQTDSAYSLMSLNEMANLSLGDMLMDDSNPKKGIAYDIAMRMRNLPPGRLNDYAGTIIGDVTRALREIGREPRYKKDIKKRSSNKI